MELTSNLKSIYRHWDIYTKENQTSVAPAEVFADPTLFDDIQIFIKERLNIWEKKVLGSLPPYTADPVMAKYRFCNVFREFDRQTIEFHTLLNPLRDNFPLWLLNMFYCRLVARPETIREVGLLSFDAEANRALHTRLLRARSPRFGTPYVFPISTIMKSETPTRELFITDYLPRKMELISQAIESWNKESVYTGVEKIITLFGFNHRFLWTEVLIDVAYQYPQHIDLFKRFPIGPGAAPTLRRINSNIDPSILVTNLALIPLHTGVTYNNLPMRLSAENWEGMGCEFRKYTNLKAGRGRKRLYR